MGSVYGMLEYQMEVLRLLKSVALLTDGFDASNQALMKATDV
jgi:hypothetical protein